MCQLGANKFLLAGYKFMSEMRLRQPLCLKSLDLHIVLVDHLQKKKKKNKEYKTLKQQEIHDIFIKTN